MNTVQRLWLTKNSTCGLWMIDGSFQCYTLEPPILPAPMKPRAIQAGTYTYEIHHSDHFGFEVPVLLDVPDFTGVEVHPGDFPRDTLGCTVVGEIHQTDAVMDSVLAFKALMLKLAPVGQIAYIDLPIAP